ncbi:MAG: histidine ammonia-lyase [Deltaproteobacteria bacterium]|nr:histidine ammonia-lyase [Deltaproteobacteria bacterium]
MRDRHQSGDPSGPRSSDRRRDPPLRSALRLDRRTESPKRPPQRPVRLRVTYPSSTKIIRSAPGVSTQGTVIPRIWVYTAAVSAPLRLGEDELTLEAISSVARGGRRVEIGARAHAAMVRAREVVDAVVRGGDAAPAVYGVNTGFGALAEVRISAGQVVQLQQNLVRSHAAGVGLPLARDCVRAMMLLRAAVLATGRSGARAVCCERLCELLNAGVHPVIPARGSVGASGDLAPLAHLALGMIGEGDAEYRGETMAAADALRSAGIEPLVLEAKEGLTLLNGTQHMTAVGGLAIHDADVTCRIADLAGAMSLEALKGTARAFDPRVVAARPHPGQIAVATFLRELLVGSEIAESHKDCGKVQDPYSLRCMPQVHGASRDVLAFARTVLEREAASSTDNPLVFLDGPDGDEMISGGNFHGQPVAIALDAAAIAVAELANISERRIEQLVNPHLSSGLPPFLAPDSGLNSGFMIAQVSAAALVSENKILAHPASVDSIPSSAGREDHVSMGATAALKLATIHDHVRTVLAIELLCAAQGVDLRRPLRTTPPLEAVHAVIRAKVPAMMVDRPIAPDIRAVRAMIDDGSLLAAVSRGSSARIVGPDRPV